MTIYYPTTSDFVQKTLNAELLSGVTAAATLNNVTAIQNKAGVMIVDRVDANGTETPSKVEVISFTATSGSTVTTLVRGLAGTTEQDHAVGAIVEFGVDIVWAQGIIDALLNVVDTTGAVDLTKVVTPSGTQMLFNKMASGPSLSGAQLKDPFISIPTLTLGSDATGDIFYRGSGGTLSRLALGTDGKFLKANASLPMWDTVTVSTKTRSAWIGANEMRDASEGSPSGVIIDAMTRVWALDPASQEGIAVGFKVPDDYTGTGGLVIKLWWSQATTAAGNVVWRMRRGATADGEVISAAANDDNTIAVPGTANQIKVSTLGTLAVDAGDLANFAIIRVAASGSDTYAADAYIVGVEVEYTSIQ